MASVLGFSFDQDTLEDALPEYEYNDVVKSLNVLISKKILRPTCCLKNILEVKVHSKHSSLNAEYHHKCFCSQVCNNDKKTITGLMSIPTKISRNHRLQFRTPTYRTAVLRLLSNDQKHNMHIQIAENLKKKSGTGLLCPSCKCSAKADMNDFTINNLQPAEMPLMDIRNCACLEKRRRTYLQIAALYESIGMKYLPVYYTIKAAKASLNLHFPIQALYYTEIAEKNFPNQWLMQIQELESLFNPIVLKATIKKTQAEAIMLLGNTYDSASQVMTALRFLGMEIVVALGLFSESEFKQFLQKLPNTHSQIITECLGVLSRISLMAKHLDLAKDLLKMEYAALTSIPTTFVQEMNHMLSLYQLKYNINRRAKLYPTEIAIIQSIQTELNTRPINIVKGKCIGMVFVCFIKTNLVAARFSLAEYIAKGAIAILQRMNDDKTVEEIHLLLFEIYYHWGKYHDAYNTLNHVLDTGIEECYFEYHSLYVCALSKIISDGYVDSAITSANNAYCKRFAYDWVHGHSQVMRCDFAFYVTARLAIWCVLNTEKKDLIEPDSTFMLCLNMAIGLSSASSKETYWSIGASLALILLNTIVAKLFKNAKYLVEKKKLLLSKQEQLKATIKKNFPVYLRSCDQLKIEILSLQ